MKKLKDSPQVPALHFLSNRFGQSNAVAKLVNERALVAVHGVEIGPRVDEVDRQCDYTGAKLCFGLGGQSARWLGRGAATIRHARTIGREGADMRHVGIHDVPVGDGFITMPRATGEALDRWDASWDELGVVPVLFVDSTFDDCHHPRCYEDLGPLAGIFLQHSELDQSIENVVS